MRSAKDLRVAPIDRNAAAALIERLHYSHSIVRNSQLHMGVFLDNQLEGAMQFGPSMDKRKLVGLVRDTPWNGFVELNRMAFSAALPRNSESRALAVAMRMIRKQYPQLQWVVSFADATNCGDGTIYRAAGFLLTGIQQNDTILIGPDGRRITNLVLTANWNDAKVIELCRHMGIEHRYRTIADWKQLGFRYAPGFQLRYLYLLDPTARARLVAPIIPFAEIEKRGAAMYLGREKQAMAGHPPAQRRRTTDLRAPTS